MDPSNIKMVFDDDMNVLYMLRIPISYTFKAIGFKYYKHIVIIRCNKKMLDFYKKTKPGKLKVIGGIDTLCFLEKLFLVLYCNGLSVDTEKLVDGENYDEGICG